MELNKYRAGQIRKHLEKIEEHLSSHVVGLRPECEIKALPLVDEMTAKAIDRILDQSDAILLQNMAIIEALSGSPEPTFVASAKEPEAGWPIPYSEE